MMWPIRYKYNYRYDIFTSFIFIFTLSCFAQFFLLTLPSSTLYHSPYMSLIQALNNFMHPENNRSMSLFKGGCADSLFCHVIIWVLEDLWTFACRVMQLFSRTCASRYRCAHTHAHIAQEEAVRERPWTHLSLWQVGLPFSGLVAWFLRGSWASPRLCCLVTVRSRPWFMQIGGQGLVGQLWYVVRPSLGQHAKACESMEAAMLQIYLGTICITNKWNNLYNSIAIK